MRSWRTLTVTVAGGLTVAVLAATGVPGRTTAGAATVKPSELHENYLLSGLPEPAPRMMGTLAHLRAGVTYQASRLPLAVRLTPPDGSWAGAQWKSARLGFRGGGPPFFGWAAVGEGGGGGSFSLEPPRGLIVIMTAYAKTPSVAPTVARLRSQGLWATYGAASHVRVAGFSALEFDGQVAAGRTHVFVPFSETNHFEDAFFVGGSEAFRVIVLGVRGKTVVVFIDSVALPPDEFPTFLTKANAILASLRFPKGA
jgi:hypothetical protein